MPVKINGGAGISHLEIPATESCNSEESHLCCLAPLPANESLLRCCDIHSGFSITFVAARFIRTPSSVTAFVSPNVTRTSGQKRRVFQRNFTWRVIQARGRQAAAHEPRAGGVAFRTDSPCPNAGPAAGTADTGTKFAP